MNDEIRCITNEGKTSRNEWEKDDSNFLLLYIVCQKKLGQFFPYFTGNTLFFCKLQIFLKVKSEV